MGNICSLPPTPAPGGRFQSLSSTHFFLPKSVIDHSNSPGVTRRQREAKGFLNGACSPWRRMWQGRTPRKLRAGGGQSSSLEPPLSSGPSLTAQMQGARTLGLPPSCRGPLLPGLRAACPVVRPSEVMLQGPRVPCSPQSSPARCPHTAPLRPWFSQWCLVQAKRWKMKS